MQHSRMIVGAAVALLACASAERPAPPSRKGGRGRGTAPSDDLHEALQHLSVSERNELKKMMKASSPSGGSLSGPLDEALRTEQMDLDGHPSSKPARNKREHGRRPMRPKTAPHREKSRGTAVSDDMLSPSFRTDITHIKRLQEDIKRLEEDIKRKQGPHADDSSEPDDDPDVWSESFQNELKHLEDAVKRAEHAQISSTVSKNKNGPRKIKRDRVSRGGGTAVAERVADIGTGNP